MDGASPSFRSRPNEPLIERGRSGVPAGGPRPPLALGGGPASYVIIKP